MLLRQNEKKSGVTGSISALLQPE